MKDPILDDINVEKENLENQRLRQKISKLQKKDYHGQVLICILICLTIIFTIIHILSYGTSIPTLLINGIVIVLYVLSLVISQANKFLSYIIAFLTYLSSKIVDIQLRELVLLTELFWFFAIIGAFIIFIYEAYKLKKLKEKL